MSDTAGGMNWWQASDGKWYPPEQHPGYGPAPQSGPDVQGAGAQYGPPPMADPPGGGPGSQYGPPPMAPPGPGYPGGYPMMGGPGPRVYAEYVNRVVAFLIDWLLVGVVVTLLELPTKLIDINNVNQYGVHHYGPTNFGGVLWLVLVVGYLTAMIGWRGQTVGMMALKIKVVDANTGQPVSYARALGRGAAEVGFFMVCCVGWIIDVLWPLWDPRRQALHDKVASTVVVPAGEPGA